MVSPHREFNPENSVEQIVMQCHSGPIQKNVKIPSVAYHVKPVFDVLADLVPLSKDGCRRLRHGGPQWI